MDMITDKLLSLKDEEYLKFHINIVPNIEKDRIIGVRVPDIRKLAKELSKEEISSFLDDIPHFYQEENMLQSILLSDIKDVDEALRRLNDFLPCVDNWAVCDTLKPKAFKKKDERIINEIKKWLCSNHSFTIRYGILALFTFYMDEKYQKEYLNLPLLVKSDDYYVEMAIAWFYQVALVKHYDDAIVYLEENRLNDFVHNKTISKCHDSYRISNERKEYLKTLRRIKNVRN